MCRYNIYTYIYSLKAPTYCSELFVPVFESPKSEIKRITGKNYFLVNFQVRVASCSILIYVKGANMRRMVLYFLMQNQLNFIVYIPLYWKSLELAYKSQPKVEKVLKKYHFTRPKKSRNVTNLEFGFLAKLLTNICIINIQEQLN